MGRAVQIHEFKPPELAMDKYDLVEDKPMRPPGPGEVAVQLRLRPVNPADIFSLQGIYAGFQPPKFPATPGLEGMGVVAKVGEGVTDFHVGQRVVPVLITKYVPVGEGSWQEFVTVSADDVVVVPDSVSDSAAAQFVVNPLTAVGLLKALGVPRGEYLLQTAAGSSLGRQVIAVAKHWGIKTINLVRRSAQKEELKALGADEVICTSDEDVVQRVKEITGGGGAYGALASVGGELFASVVSSTRDSGTVLLYGAMGSFSFTASIPDILFRDVRINGYWVTPFIGRLSREEKHAFFAEVMELIENHVIVAYEGEFLDLALFKDAALKEGVEGREGKIFLTG